MVRGVFYLHILWFANIRGCPFFLVDELLFRLHNQRCATSGGCSYEQWRMFLQVHWPSQLLFILSLACFCFISSDWIEYYLRWIRAWLVDLNSFLSWQLVQLSIEFSCKTKVIFATIWLFWSRWAINCLCVSAHMLAGSFPAWLKRNADLQRCSFSMLLLPWLGV